MSSSFGHFLHRRRPFSFRPTNVVDGLNARSVSVTVDLNNSNAFLGTTHYMNGANVPVMNVGANQLKFLTSMSTSRVRRFFTLLRRKHCMVHRHDLLQLAADGAPARPVCTLGRVTMSGRSDSSVLTVRATISNRHLAACVTSNLLVTAPANSATCSLDTNNPVVCPRTSIFMLATMSPRDLGIHPVIVTSSGAVGLRVRDHDNDFLITTSNVDRDLPRSAALAVRGTSCAIHIIGRRNDAFFRALRGGVL